MNVLRIAFFLAYRRIKRNSLWTTVLIVFVMSLTFLNLVFVTGILTGLPAGASSAYKTQYSGDIFVSSLPEKTFIQQSNQLLDILDGIEDVAGYTSRYVGAGSIQANYQKITKSNNEPDQIGAVLVGINPFNENAWTSLGDYVVEGEYLSSNDEGKILVGSNLLSEYTQGAVSEGETLEDVVVGSKILLRMSNGFSKELTVKGIIKSKAGEVDRRVYFTERELRKLLERTDYNVDEIAVFLKSGATDLDVKARLLKSGVGVLAKVETSRESQGQFLEDIENTFSVLGNVIGSIGLVVASITIFIVIFINAITRRKFIGILKAIGISKQAIQASYILQAFFYALIGIIIGVLVVFLLLKPYFDTNPIDFPFSDGILLVDTFQIVMDVILLSVATVIAGYIPARIVVRGNTLDAILGR